MEMAQNLSLLAVGVGSIERRLLNGIIRLSTARDRARHYRWYDPETQQHPDVVVAMTHNEAALREICGRYCDAHGNPRLPVVILGSKDKLRDPFLHIGGPLVTTRVLDELDRTTAHVHA